MDLNPHQLDAALFAFRAPLSRGAILADEVGLGKTIEAALVISQLWAEHKRRILVIAPAILRKQWQQELLQKFFLESRIIDTREYNAACKVGELPLEPANRVVIASYHFAAARWVELKAIPWDLVVIDEAHRLRNVYKSSAKIANAIKAAVSGRPLLLLTATPLQNDLLELYGLVSFIDEHIFSDIAAFKARYKGGGAGGTANGRPASAAAVGLPAHPGRQVAEYVPFTDRISITQDFTPTAEEQELYNQVSAYLQRDTLHALPAGQRKLMTLVLRNIAGILHPCHRGHAARAGRAPAARSTQGIRQASRPAHRGESLKTPARPRACSPRTRWRVGGRWRRARWRPPRRLRDGR